MKCRKFEDHQLTASTQRIKGQRLVVLTCDECSMRVILGRAKRRSLWTILKNSIKGE